MKIITVLGARPQFIKAAMLSKEFLKSNTLDEIIIHTGQHFDKKMSEIFFNELKIPIPDFNLGIKSLYHGEMTGKQIEMIEKHLYNIQPDGILVYGDTNSTLSASIAASKMQIPIFHVEAGLRSFNRKMPEEINRVITDHVSSLLFTPNLNAKNNLLKEGIDPNKIYNVGDVMNDALLYYLKIAEQKSNILKRLNLKSKDYFLATVHRQENTDDQEKLKEIFMALSLANKPVVIPMHPRTKKKIKEYSIQFTGSLIPIEPVSYFDMLILEKNAKKIITDSGGIQKEAYLLGVHCITLRNETEWVELIEIGVNKLSKISKDTILNKIHEKTIVFGKTNIYGDGFSSSKIIQIINNYLINN